MRTYTLLSPLIFLLFFASCKWDLKTVDPVNPKFTTNDSAVLFFKNLRQTNYHKETLTEAKIDVYRHKKGKRDEGESSFHLALVHNWMIDEVVIFIEPSGLFLSDSIHIVIGDQQPELFVKGTKYQQFEWVAKIYNAILEEKEVLVLHPEKGKIPLFYNGEKKEAFRVSCKDFFKLVQIFR